LFKIRKPLPNAHYTTLELNLEERLFQVNQKHETTNLTKIEAGILQGSVLRPVLYLIYTGDLPTSENTTTSTFADDTSILATHEDPAIASMKFQDNISKIKEWASKS
jgi:hypothetical protein